MTANDASDHKGKKKGLRRLINATRYSVQGINAALKHEAAFREECILAVILIPAALFLPVGSIEKLMLVQSTLLVLLVEILNSGLEACVDRFGPEIHPLAGRAKDMGSAAVLFALFMAGTAWLVIAGPLLWQWIFA